MRSAARALCANILIVREKKELPRILVLSGEIPQTRNAGAIVLHRLFAGYGRQAEPAGDGRLKLGDGAPAKPAEDRRMEIGDGGRTSNSELPSSASPPAKLFVIGPGAHPEAVLLDCPYRELRMPLARLDNTRLSMWKRSLTVLGLIPLPAHRRVMGLLGGYKPDALVCVMVNTPWMLLAERTARRVGVPLVLIVHDLNEEFEKVFPWARRALFKRNRQVYRAAARRLCVSPEMVDYLEKRYGVPGEVMYPNRSEELQPRPLEMSLTLRAEVAAATPEDRR